MRGGEVAHRCDRVLWSRVPSLMCHRVTTMAPDGSPSSSATSFAMAGHRPRNTLSRGLARPPSREQKKAHVREDGMEARDRERGLAFQPSSILVVATTQCIGSSSCRRPKVTERSNCARLGADGVRADEVCVAVAEPQVTRVQLVAAEHARSLWVQAAQVPLSRTCGGCLGCELQLRRQETCVRFQRWNRSSRLRGGASAGRSIR